MSYSRFAIYYIPPEGDLADFGAAWLGWDVARGRAAAQPDLPGLKEVTGTPHKYGFHGTLKPPFALAPGKTLAGLEEAVATLAADTAAARCEGLELATLGRFLALVPSGDMAALTQLAGDCVRALDGFRAAPDAAELERRRKAGLSPRQEALLVQWGYPYVMEEFRFHLTLTGRLAKETVADWRAAVERHLPPLPAPFIVGELALCGERADGRFELVHRYTLAG